MKSKNLFTAILLGCILSVVVPFKVNIKPEVVEQILESSRGLQLPKQITFYHNNECFEIFNSKKITSQAKNETVMCIEGQEKSLRSNFKEFSSKIAAKLNKLSNFCDPDGDSPKYSECYDKIESQLVAEVSSKTVEFLSKLKINFKHKHDCLSKSVQESKIKSTSSLSELKDCLLENGLPELNLDYLQVNYNFLRTCVQGGKDDFNTCLKKNMVAINGQGDRLREISAKYWEKINAFDQKENSCLRHFIAGIIFPDFTFAFDFEKCLKIGFNALMIKQNDDENLAHGFLNLHNALVACRIDLDKTNIEKCISKTLVDSDEASFIEWRLQRLSVEDLRKSYNKIQEVFKNKLDCSGYIFEKLTFRGLFTNGSAKEDLNKCMDKYYVSNSELPTMNDAVSKLKMIEIDLKKCIQYPNGPQLSDCFAKIIDGSESSLNYIEKYFDKFKSLVLNMAEVKRNGISALLELQDDLLRISLPSLPVFDLDKLKNIYKTLRACANNHLHDFDICLKESAKAVEIIKERLIEVSEKSVKEINTFDQNEDACLRHFIVGMVSTESDCTHDFLKNCLIHGLNKSRIEQIDDENLIKEYKNLQNALLACRFDSNATFIEKCISETLLNSNEARYIGCNIRTLSEESLRNRTNKTNDVLNNEAICIRYIFEKIKFSGLFMEGSDKEEYKKCMDKYYVSNTELPNLKDVVNKLKMIETAFIKCYESASVPNCFAEIIAANERSLVYIEINFFQFQGLAMKMYDSALKELEHYLELYELNKIYKSVQTCVKDGKADFSKCMEVTKKLQNQKDRLIEISEKDSEKINYFDLKEDSCFRHFITKIVFPEFIFDLESCLKNGFKETLLKDNANENLIKEFENLRNALSICRVDSDKSNIEKCISEKLVDSNEIQRLLHTSSEEDLKILKSQIYKVFDNENDCIGYVFEKIHFRGLFMNGLTKNNFKICMDKRYVNLEKALEKDAINKFKTIVNSLNKCTQNRAAPEFSKCVAEIIEANESSLDYIDNNFDKLRNIPSDAVFPGSNYDCLKEIMSRKDIKCSSNKDTYPDIERCIFKRVFVFEPNDIEIEKKQLNVRYSSVKDIYERYIKDGPNVAVVDTYKTWQSAQFYSEHMFRHRETDHKMLYLAREDNHDRAEIVWKFDFSKTNLKIKKHTLRFDKKAFLNSCMIEFFVRNAEGSKEVDGSRDLVIMAKLSGWDSICTQLFRQSFTSEEYPFDLNVELGL